MSRTLDLRGQVFGELRALEPIEIGYRGTDSLGMLWRCECIPCGRQLVRPAGQLRAASRNGQVSACNECRAEVRGGKRIMRDKMRREYFAKMWDDYNTLYAWDNQLIDALEPEPVTEHNCAAIPADELIESTEQHAQHEATLDEVGSVLELSRERVRQIEAKALRKLRAWFSKNDELRQNLWDWLGGQGP